MAAGLVVMSATGGTVATVDEFTRPPPPPPLDADDDDDVMPSKMDEGRLSRLAPMADGL